MNQATEPTIEQPTGEAHPLARVQCDMFCQACGTNLFDQPVWRTEEARLLVARCPRCRKLAPANETLPYRRAWRQRLGVAAMLLWFFFLAGLLAMVFAGEVVMQDESAAKEWKPVVNPMPDPASRMSYGHHELHFSWPRTVDYLKVTIPLSLLLTVAAGVVLACVVYHWRTAWHLLAVVAVPAVGPLVMWFGYHDSDYYRPWLDGGAWAVFWAVAAVQAAGGAVGVLIGRPVGRGVLRVLLPNRSRQFFSCLWRRDGKAVPQGPF